MRTIGDTIKQLRDNKRWSMQDLADLMELKSYTTVSKWESNENHPRGREIRMLCELFNVSADYLLGLKENTKTEHINYYRYFPVSVSAGLLNEIDSVTEESCQWITMHDDMMGKYAGTADIFFVNISGTSMNKIMPSGSLVAVKPIDSIIHLKDGDIVIFGKVNEFSIKRFYNDTENNRLLFRPESTDNLHTDIVISKNAFEDVRIYGKVILHIAQFS